MQGMGFIVIYIVFFAALIYFTSIRPQKKERQKQQEMLQCRMHTYRNCMFSAKCLLVFQLHSV